MGGALLQQVNRDTCSFAMKCSSITVNGQNRDVFKDPITDKCKKSKSGRLELILNQNGNVQTVNIGTNESHPYSVMRVVFENGKLCIDEKFDTIRERVSF